MSSAIDDPATAFLAVLPPDARRIAEVWAEPGDPTSRLTGPPDRVPRFDVVPGNGLRLRDHGADGSPPRDLDLEEAVARMAPLDAVIVNGACDRLPTGERLLLLAALRRALRPGGALVLSSRNRLDLLRRSEYARGSTVWAGRRLLRRCGFHTISTYCLIRDGSRTPFMVTYDRKRLHGFFDAQRRSGDNGSRARNLAYRALNWLGVLPALQHSFLLVGHND